MKRLITLFLAVITLLALFAGCGTAKKDYDALLAEKQQLESDYNTLKAEHEKLESEHVRLINDTADWLRLSEDEKQARLAQAEVERIEAEEAANRVAEEQAAAAAQAAAEKAAAEEAIVKESVSLKDLLIEPEKYDGEFVRITDELKVGVNHLEKRYFFTTLSTGSRRADVDNSFTLDVFYNNMSDYKTWAGLSTKDSPRITVAGTFHIYANRNNTGYLDASEIVLCGYSD